MMSSTCKRIMVTGLVGGAIKMGWEALVPPRTPEREEEPPPMTLYLRRLNMLLITTIKMKYQ